MLMDRLGIITEQAPLYCPSAKGTVEALFRWMTQRFERRLPNTSYGIHDAEAAAQAGSMTLEELERYFYQAIVDDYQQAWDKLRRHKRCMLWEHAVAQRGVPQYLGSPDDLKLLLIPQGTDGPGAIAVRSSTWAVACFSSARQDHPAESETLDQPDLTWLQWRRRLDKLQPFCRIAGHTSEEVRDILATLETVYREVLPQLNLRQWTGFIYASLTQPVFDPTHSGRVTMDDLMKLVTIALEWSYEAHDCDV